MTTVAAGTGGDLPVNPGNLTSPEILTSWAGGVQQLNWDQWCWYMHQHFPAFTCPSPEDFGGGQPNARRLGTAREFLDALRNYFSTATTVPGITNQGGGAGDVPAGNGGTGGGNPPTSTGSNAAPGGLSLNWILGGVAALAIVYVVVKKSS